MSSTYQPTASLIPSPAELRSRLAVALREVELLRRLIRLSEKYERKSKGTNGVAGEEATDGD